MVVRLDLRTIVVAGCSSGVGKTAVAETVTGILSGLCRTAAAKITVTHGDRGCPHGGKGCNVCSSLGGNFQIIVKDSVILQAGTDTARLKAAGGSPVIWAITRDVAIELAWQGMTALLSEIDCVVIESNSLAEHIDPSLTIMVVDASVSRKIWKPSAERLIARADYVLFNNRGPKVKSDVLLDEIRSLRGDLPEAIVVTHPRELIFHEGLIQDITSMCLPY